MSVAMVERWDAPGAPVVLLEKVQKAEASYFEAIGKLGISREAYVIVAREAVKEARAIFESMAIRSRKSTAPEGADSTGVARWSTLLGSFERLLHDFARAGWAVFWPTMRKVAETFGTEIRAAWERLRMLRDAQLLQAWERWDNKSHEYEEGRSNVYFLTVPLEVFEWWVTLPKAKALLASLGGAGADVHGPPELPARQRSAPPPPRKAEPTAPAALPAFFPALFHAVRGADTRYHGEDERRGGTMKPENAIACEDILRDEAAAARAFCEKHGWSAPDVAALARELGRMVVSAWLKEAGRDNALVEKRHAFGLLFFDVSRLAAAARQRWQDRQERRAAPTETPTLRDKPRFLGPTEEGACAALTPVETPADLEERRQAVAEFRALLPSFGEAGEPRPSDPDKPPRPPD